MDALNRWRRTQSTVTLSWEAIEITTMRKLAIVPAYNEEGSVALVVAAINEHAPGFDVLVVDDGSTDRTRSRAEQAGATVLQHPFNLGIGGAVQTGFKYASRNGYEVAVQIDGDGQHDPTYVPQMLELLHSDGVDIVCGSRFREHAGYGVPLRRRLGITIFSVMLSLIVRQRVTDPTSGFRMTNRRGIELFARDYPHDYPEVEAIVMMHSHRLRMRELPVRMSERISGRSSITNTLGAYYMVKVVLAVLVNLFRRQPTVEAGAPAPVRAERGI
jgi:glycosyltransferase involved in cell wall biosynthesis